MKGWPVEDRRLAEFLLGRLASDEQAELEEKVFVDDDFEEQLDATADDLIHAYLEGELSADDRDAFETHFLTSLKHRDRFTFVQDLLAAVQRSPAAPAARPWPTWGVWAAAAALLAALAAALVLRQEPPPPKMAEDVRQTPSPSTPSAGPTPSEAPLPSPSARPSRNGTREIVRLARRTGPAPAEVRLSGSTRTVRVEVPVAQDGPAAYDAVLRDARGTQVWQAEGVSPESEEGPLLLDIPARLLASGDYQLQVEGEQLRDMEAAPPRQFPLRVVREP
jgi:hypothetical protein